MIRYHNYLSVRHIDCHIYKIPSLVTLVYVQTPFDKDVKLATHDVGLSKVGEILEGGGKYNKEGVFC